MKIKVLDVAKQLTMTKDNVRLSIDASVAYRITNPVLSYYVIGNAYLIVGTN
jgi:regulator of protease activity HflC (stomatin/prohibitin superfamily)